MTVCRDVPFRKDVVFASCAARPEELSAQLHPKQARLLFLLVCVHVCVCMLMYTCMFMLLLMYTCLHVACLSWPCLQLKMPDVRASSDNSFTWILGSTGCHRQLICLRMAWQVASLSLRLPVELASLTTYTAVLMLCCAMCGWQRCTPLLPCSVMLWLRHAQTRTKPPRSLFCWETRTLPCTLGGTDAVHRRSRSQIVFQLGLGARLSWPLRHLPGAFAIGVP